MQHPIVTKYVKMVRQQRSRLITRPVRSSVDLSVYAGAEGLAVQASPSMSAVPRTSGLADRMFYNSI